MPILWMGLPACGPSEVADEAPAPAEDAGRNVRDRSTDGGDGTSDAAGGGPEVECEINIDCYDENPCTLDICEGGVCANVPNDQGTPSQVVGNCQVEICSAGILIFETDDTDVSADDGFDCTESRCEFGVLFIDVDHGLCDDGNRCNGEELCSFTHGCIPGIPVDFDEDGIPDIVDPTPPDADGDGITDCLDWETCDGIDNDHNGLVDDDPIDDDLGGLCYDGPVGTDGVGQCTPGRLDCVSGRIVCIDQVLPSALEYCDGLDNDCDDVIPAEELDLNCTTRVEFGPDDDGPQEMRLEFPTALRRVDIHFNIDTTGSMSGALNALRNTVSSTIVPAVTALIPVAAFGVSTFEDYPMLNFGSGTDLPFELWQRITNRVDLVQAQLAAITLGSGNDLPESGIESLYQLATGAGTRWPRRGGIPTVDPSTMSGFAGEIDPTGDIDYFFIEASAGEFLQTEIVASRLGSSVDSTLELLDSGGTRLAYNDDFSGLDPALSLTLIGEPPYYLKVAGRFSSSAGWYYLQVLVSGSPIVPMESACSDLEVGWDPFEGTGGAIVLVALDEATPRDDPATCQIDCEAVISSPSAAAAIRSYCYAGAGTTCGDGTVDDLEECDDGNRFSGDGCSAMCTLETEGVPRFNPDFGFDPGLGHGRLGGAGFREDALPIIVHATDAISHSSFDYTARDSGIEAHDVDETFSELEKLGARIVGIARGQPAVAPITDPLNPPGMAFRTGSLVPPCAFDGSEPRESGVCLPDQCCVGRGGAGRPPPDGADGLCVLSFEMENNGSGLTDGVVLGIQALAQFATYTVTPVLIDDPRNPRDARCFVQSIEVAEVVQDSECAPEPVLADRDEDGSFETIENATPQALVTYVIKVENRDSHDFDGDLDTSEPCGPPGTYYLRVDITGDDVTVLSSQMLTFTITEE
jgi:cysteine-rich repeat protein